MKHVIVLCILGTTSTGLCMQDGLKEYTLGDVLIPQLQKNLRQRITKIQINKDVKAPQKYEKLAVLYSELAHSYDRSSNQYRNYIKQSADYKEKAISIAQKTVTQPAQVPQSTHMMQEELLKQKQRTDLQSALKRHRTLGNLGCTIAILRKLTELYEPETTKHKKYQEQLQNLEAHKAVLAARKEKQEELKALASSSFTNEFEHLQKLARLTQDIYETYKPEDLERAELKTQFISLKKRQALVAPNANIKQATLLEALSL